MPSVRNTDTGFSATVSAPSGTVTGDWLVVLMYASGPTPHIGPLGWTPISTPELLSGFWQGTWTKQREVTDTTYTWTSAGSDFGYIVAAIQDTVGVGAGIDSNHTDTVEVNTNAGPMVVQGANGSLLITFLSLFQSDVSTRPYLWETEVPSSGIYMTMASRVQDYKGTTLEVVWNHGASESYTSLLEFRAPAQTGDVQSVASVVVDGDEDELQLDSVPEIGDSILVFISDFAVDPDANDIEDNNTHPYTRDVFRSYADSPVDGQYSGIAVFRTVVTDNSVTPFQVKFLPLAADGGIEAGRWWTWAVMHVRQLVTTSPVDDFDSTEQYNTTTVNGGSATPTTSKSLCLFYGMTRGHDTRPMVSPVGLTKVVSNQEDSRLQSGFLFWEIRDGDTSAFSPTGNIIDGATGDPAEIVGCRSGVVVYKIQGSSSGTTYDEAISLDLRVDAGPTIQKTLTVSTVIAILAELATVSQQTMAVIIPLSFQGGVSASPARHILGDVSLGNALDFHASGIRYLSSSATLGAVLQTSESMLVKMASLIHMPVTMQVSSISSLMSEFVIALNNVLEISAITPTDGGNTYEGVVSLDLDMRVSAYISQVMTSLVEFALTSGLTAVANVLIQGRTSLPVVFGIETAMLRTLGGHIALAIQTDIHTYGRMVFQHLVGVGISVDVASRASLSFMQSLSLNSQMVLSVASSLGPEAIDITLRFALETLSGISFSLSELHVMVQFTDEKLSFEE